ncbi:hypothetical protein CHUAL_008657 [Chamberlinius hualienensis]
MTEWDNESVSMFVEYLQTEPAIWDQNHPQHKDRSKVNAAWERLSQKTGYSVDVMKAKKTSIMATFRGHMRRKRKFMSSGAGEGEVYQPIWYLYEQLESFLGGNSSTGNTERILSAEEGESSSDQAICAAQVTRYANSKPTPVKKPQVKSNLAEPTNLMCDCGKRVCEEDIIAKTWMYKLKRMRHDQKLYAEKFINDILIEGELGNLHRDAISINHPMVIVPQPNHSPSHDYN